MTTMGGGELMGSTSTHVGGATEKECYWLINKFYFLFPNAYNLNWFLIFTLISFPVIVQ